MKRKITRPKFVLLDANVIIKAYEIEVWPNLINQFQIAIPSTIIHDEALFYFKKKNVIHWDIDLPKLANEGKIRELTVSSSELRAIYDKFDKILEIHKGEAEALALFNSGQIQDYRFCTSDAAAIQGMAVIGHSSEGISMEELLSCTGLKRRLPHEYTEAYFKKWLKVGQILFIQNF